MSFKCSIRLKTAIRHLMLSFDTVFMCKIGVNYQYISLDIYLLLQSFQKPDERKTGIVMEGV